MTFVRCIADFGSEFESGEVGFVYFAETEGARDEALALSDFGIITFSASAI